MLKSYHYGAILLSLAASNITLADCSSPQVTSTSAPNLFNLLAGRTVCVRDSAGALQSQEEHHSDFELWEYAKGDDDLVDPRKKIGTWGITADDRVSYTYSNSAFVFSLHNNGRNSYTFCDGATEVVPLAFLSAGPGC